MYFAVFTYRPRSKLVFSTLILLIFLTQLIAWVIRSTYELFNYNGCSYSMQGVMTCSDYSFTGCIGPSIQDCDKANAIINLFTAGIIYPLVMLIYVGIYTIMFYFCNCNSFGILRCQQFLWFVCYCICSALYFIAASNLGVLSSRNVQVNSQVTATSIVLGLLCILIVVTIIFINFDLNAYLKYNIYQLPPTIQAPIVNQQVTYTNVQLHTQQANNNNITMQHQIQNQQLELRNLQLQMELQQRNSLILQQNQMINSLGPAQQQHYQPGLIGQPVPNQQEEHPVQGVPFQEVEIR
ncbi:hypothetical protein pb186bvf_003174 [Paramecium bursaria]